MIKATNQLLEFLVVTPACSPILQPVFEFKLLDSKLAD